MENGQLTILNLFNGDKHFVIPKYQRTYAWEEKQLKDFLDDIENQKVNRDYFIGTLLFQNRGVENGFERIEIVDGQQRLITITIFMKVVLKFLSEKESMEKYGRDIRKYVKDDDIYKLELTEMDNDFFKTYIMEDNRIEDKFLKTPSQRRLLFAKKYFEEFVQQSNIDALKVFKDKIERTKLLVYTVNDTAEATLIFETTNDRGKSLTNLEKMKSFLMYKAYLTKDKPHELLMSIHDRFSDIYRTLEEINSKVEEDSILQYHFIAHLKWSYSRTTKDYQKDVEKTKNKINKLMKSGNPEKVADFIDKYSRELKETFNVINFILKDNQKTIKDLFILGRMSLFYPLMIKCYKLDKTENKSDFYEIIRLLEIFSFRVYALGRKPAKTGETWLYSAAKDFDGDFTELKSKLKGKIIEYVWDSFFESLIKSSSLYQSMMSKDLRYLFWKYENFLRTDEQPKASEMSSSEFLNQDPKFKLTIEHIACQNPKVTNPELKLPEFNQNFIDNYLNSIGNLTFDPNSANASKGNGDIEAKNSRYFKKAPFKTQNELENFIKDDRWTDTSITERADKIIEFAKNYWNPDIV